MYELYDPVTVMFFFRNKHMMCDFGTGNNNKMNFLLENKDELIDILEEIYRGARKGRGLVTSPKGTSPVIRMLPSVHLCLCRLFNPTCVLITPTAFSYRKHPEEHGV
jgi:hypothetical protein